MKNSTVFAHFIECFKFQVPATLYHEWITFFFFIWKRKMSRKFSIERISSDSDRNCIIWNFAVICNMKAHSSSSMNVKIARKWFQIPLNSLQLNSRVQKLLNCSVRWALKFSIWCFHFDDEFLGRTRVFSFLFHFWAEHFMFDKNITYVHFAISRVLTTINVWSPIKKMKISIQWNENGKKYFSVLVALAFVFFSFCDKTNNWLRRDCDLWHNRQSTGEFGRVRSMCVGSNCEKFFLFSFFLVAEHVTQALTCWC